MNSKIPIYKPIIGELEKEYVINCLNDTWISSKGEYIEKFEYEVGNYIGADFCSTTSNGTTALHLSFLALGIGKGDEVITTNFTYVASTNAILMVGAKPIFCDVNENDLNINTDLIEHSITHKTKALLVTNVYGNMANFEALNTIAKKYNLYLIEDAAESLGATFKGKKSGNLADVSTLSFFGNKTITTGEGGMVICKKEEHLKKINQLKNQGNSSTKTYFHDFLGYNYRMTNIQAAIGCAQLQKINSILKSKKRVFEFYKSSLYGFVEFLTPIPDSNSSYWMVPIISKTKSEKEKIVNNLSQENIETRPFFTPVDLLPFYEKSKCNTAKKLFKKGILLPSYPDLTEKELEKICIEIKKSIK